MKNRTMLLFTDISSLLLFCVRVVADMQDSGKDKYNSICCAFGWLFDICSKLEIDIEKYIMLTMAYNKTRPYKHGKKY